MVLVVGSGIAGITAAICAARAGAPVTLACVGPLFGGSSFYPGTWGLGLIGPEDANDEDDLIETILRVGGGVAEPELVEVFVRNIRPAMQWLEEDLGVELARPANEDSAREQAFIPCFDHKQRLWRGITREPFEAVARAEIERLGITVLPKHELMALMQDAGTVTGAVLYDRAANEFRSITANALVLAAGGTGGLFERSLTSGDVLSSVHGVALDAGATLTNIEFMQMMPGLVWPKRGIVFNEKAFRFTQMDDAAGILPKDFVARAELLEMRSAYGPFTSRLASRVVDLAIDAAGPEGMPVRCVLPESGVPEFVQTFATWLEREHGIAPGDEMRIALYAHAANGGIRIDTNGWTGVPGLYAAGELTGGMHGADRIGGLSSANGLVFGRRAGEAAARAGQASGTNANTMSPRTVTPSALSPIGLAETDARDLTSRLKRTMSAHCMVRRSESGLTQALADLDAIASAAEQQATRAPSAPSVARLIRLRSQLALARAMAEAMHARTTSLGSHHRVDSVE